MRRALAWSGVAAVFEESSNDNDARPVDERGPDAHAQAAMLLVESLIHGLVERSVISVEDAVEVVETAIEVQAEVVDELEDSPALRRSLTMLTSISLSLRQDMRAR